MTESTCADGNDLVVWIDEFGHSWPVERIHGFDIDEPIWDFLSSHPGG